MNAIDFFDSDAAELPRDRDDDNFEAFLAKMFCRYIHEINNLQANDYVTQTIAANQQTITDLCKHIREAVRHYLQGCPHLAFQDIDKGIQAIRAHFDRLCTPVSVAQPPALSELYRIRTAGPEGNGFQRSDLFHIPFEKRHLVTRQRYSLPGLPCLYLGGTLYIAWEELGRPNFDSIFYARFKPQSQASITFLDFGYRPALIAEEIKASQRQCQKQSGPADFAVAQAVCWPLLAACSIKRRHGAAPFIHEYIIPQLVLQWITRNRDSDGIRYFSVNATSYMRNPAMACNYVFPARDIAPQGQCSILRRKFEMSVPLSWQLIDSMTMPHGMTFKMPVHGDSKIEFVHGHPIRYVCTPFGAIEGKSVAYPCEPC